MNGVVVHGRGGRRSEYRPIVSRLASTCDPLVIAEGFREHFGLSELYLADLDAIAGQAPTFATFQQLSHAGFRLWIDAGIHDREEADRIAATGAGVVVGLETVRGPAVLADILRHHEQTVFSLDMRNGVPLGTGWHNADAIDIADQAVDSGAKRILILDLARVGMNQGCGTEETVDHVATAHPEVEIWVGGGIRDVKQLSDLERRGVSVALIASALHDGGLRPQDQRL